MLDLLTVTTLCPSSFSDLCYHSNSPNLVHTPQYQQYTDMNTTAPRCILKLSAPPPRGLQSCSALHLALPSQLVIQRYENSFKIPGLYANKSTTGEQVHNPQIYLISAFSLFVISLILISSPHSTYLHHKSSTHAHTKDQPTRAYSPALHSCIHSTGEAKSNSRFLVQNL